MHQYQLEVCFKSKNLLTTYLLIINEEAFIMT